MELSRLLYGESEIHCSALIRYSRSLRSTGKEYTSYIEEVDSILDKGEVQLGGRNRSDLSKLRKGIESKDYDQREEDRADIERYRAVEDEEGKESFRYMKKKTKELRVASTSVQEKSLVAETEELIELADKTSFH